MAREEVVRSPVLIRVGEAAWVQPLFIDRLFVDARLNEYPLLAINGRCFVVVMMMLDDLTMHDRRRDVGLLDDLTLHDRWLEVSFPFWIRPKVRSQSRTGEAHDRHRQESEALHHCMLLMR
jgi:hypothetical protein